MKTVTNVYSREERDNLSRHLSALGWKLIDWYYDYDLYIKDGEELKVNVIRLMKIKMTKEMIGNLNKIAYEDFDRAKAMLDGINMVLGTQYGWLDTRVAIFDNPNGSVAERYASAHDAWAFA